VPDVVVAAEPVAKAPNGTPGRPDITSTDPKVVIEPATPSKRVDAEQDVSTIEPPRGSEGSDDQPKRRGWWNRFM